MNTPLIVIVGETASGKSALGLELAERFNGEIICADSRTVYRGMDIGTAKPSAADQRRVRHHCLDVADPDERFTAADFKRLALEAIDDIQSREKLPIMVGGTGLYIDAVLFDYQFRQAADPEKRAVLNQLTVDELQAKLVEQGIKLPENARNPRHLIRALETNGQISERQPLRENTLILGLRVDRDVLTRRIHDRIDAMVGEGLVDEARRLGETYGWDLDAMLTTSYQPFKEYLNGTVTLDAAKDLFARSDLQLAKRQRTWFKRNNSIHWLANRDNIAESVELTTTFLHT